MSTENPSNTPSLPKMGESENSVTSQVGEDRGVSIERGGVGDPRAQTAPGGIELDDDGIHHEDGGPEGGDTTKEEGAPEEPEKSITLPDFDAAKPEVVAEYDKTFLGEDGKSFNLANLSTNFFENAEVDWDTGTVKGGLPETTRSYLASKGIDNATIDAVVEGQIAKTIVERNALFEAAGGRERYAAAIEWATKGGGYSESQRAAFNKALDQGGQARADAVEALMARASKANPSLMSSGTPQRKQVSPARSVSDAGGDSAGSGPKDVYTSTAEWRQEFRKAKQDGDQKAFNEVRAKYARSKAAKVPGFN